MDKKKSSQDGKASSSDGDEHESVRESEILQHQFQSLQLGLFDDGPKTKERLSSERRLMQLPDVFTTSMLSEQLGGNHAAAPIYTQRWKKDGLIVAAGLKAGVFYNLARNRRADTEKAYQALIMIYPDAIIALRSSLYDHGWIEHAPRTLEVIVERRQTYPQLYQFSASGRSRRWMAMIDHEISKRGHPRLSPYGALVDLWAHSDVKPDMGTVDCSKIDWERLHQVFHKLLVKWPEEFKEHYTDIDALESMVRKPRSGQKP